MGRRMACMHSSDVSLTCLLAVLWTGVRAGVRTGAGTWNDVVLAMSIRETAAALASFECRPGLRTFSCTTDPTAPQQICMCVQLGVSKRAQSSRLMPGSQQAPQSCAVRLQKLACTSSPCLSVQGKQCVGFQQSVASCRVVVPCACGHPLRPACPHHVSNTHLR